MFFAAGPIAILKSAFFDLCESRTRGGDGPCRLGSRETNRNLIRRGRPVRTRRRPTPSYPLTTPET